MMQAFKVFSTYLGCSGAGVKGTRPISYRSPSLTPQPRHRETGPDRTTICSNGESNQPVAADETERRLPGCAAREEETRIGHGVAALVFVALRRDRDEKDQSSTHPGTGRCLAPAGRCECGVTHHRPFRRRQPRQLENKSPNPANLRAIALRSRCHGAVVCA